MVYNQTDTSITQTGCFALNNENFNITLPLMPLLNISGEPD